MLPIKKVHERNLHLISLHNILPGTKFINKISKVVEIIEYTHNFYGWLKTTEKDNQQLPQDVYEALKYWDIK